MTNGAPVPEPGEDVVGVASGRVVPDDPHALNNSTVAKHANPAQ
jgi:hypothetical protein